MKQHTEEEYKIYHKFIKDTRACGAEDFVDSVVQIVREHNVLLSYFKKDKRFPIRKLLKHLGTNLYQELVVRYKEDGENICQIRTKYWDKLNEDLLERDVIKWGFDGNTIYAVISNDFKDEQTKQEKDTWATE